MSDRACSNCKKSEAECPWGPAGVQGPKLYVKDARLLCWSCLNGEWRTNRNVARTRGRKSRDHG